MKDKVSRAERQRRAVEIAYLDAAFRCKDLAEWPPSAEVLQREMQGWFKDGGRPVTVGSIAERIILAVNMLIDLLGAVSVEDKGLMQKRISAVLDDIITSGALKRVYPEFVEPRP